MGARLGVTLVLAVLLIGCGGDAGVSSTTAAPSTAVPPATTSTSGAPVSSTTSEPTTTTTTEASTTTVPLPGLLWGRVSDPQLDLGGPGGQEMNAVVAAGPGLVAVGSEWSEEGLSAVVWVSEDGLDWERVPYDGTVFGGHGLLRMEAVVAAGPGLVAVGSDEPDGQTDAAVWISPDGLNWERVNDEAFGGPGSQYMMGVSAGGPGVVAVGYAYADGATDGVVWTSPDGRDWTRLPDDGMVFGGPGNQRVWDVVAGGPGLVALGQDGPPDELFDAAVWTSADGLTWTRIHIDQAVGIFGLNPRVHAVVVGDEGLTAVGSEGAGHGWLGPNVDLDAAVWRSPDGITWTAAPYDPAQPFSGLFEGGDQDMRGLAAVPGGFVAVGYEGPIFSEAEALFPDITGPDADAAVWTSADGIRWILVPADESVFGGLDDQVMWGVTAWGPGLVAVGADYSSGDGDAAVWVSPPPA